jgi:hypothetical protein
VTLADTAQRLHLRPVETPAEVRFWFRTNASGVWQPIESRAAIERLVLTRDGCDPWVTIASLHGDGHPETAAHAYFQMLQGDDPTQAAVSGGIWDPMTDTGNPWTSWAAGVPRGRRVEVGPPWYSISVWEASLQTVDDALRQLWPALTDQHHAEHTVPGYRWRSMYLDPDITEGLRA